MTVGTKALNISLAERIGAAGGILREMRDEAFVMVPIPGLVGEFTNYRDEQAAWRETAAFLDQSHHMIDLYVTGPDALKLFSHLGINRFDNFGPGKAKQFVATDENGWLIGDAILFHLDEGSFDLVGLPYVTRWVQYHIEHGDFDVTYEWDDFSSMREGRPPREYRFEVQGPTAFRVIEAATGAPIPDTKFFSMEEFTIAGHRVRGLRHGMAAQPGFELFGPWEEGEAVRSAILEAGKEFGLKLVGSRAYWTATLESGWVSLPVPAFITADSAAGFRDWIDGSILGSIGGSANSDSIEDYYITPFELGYGRLIDFDHDFIGRDALLAMKDAEHRTKVTLVWNGDDVKEVLGGLVDGDPDSLPPKYLELPKSRYARFTYDKVLVDGQEIGLSLDTGYLSPVRSFLSLAVVDPAFAEPGTEVTVLWGEDPAHQRSTGERHRQVVVRATVAPVPFSGQAHYRKNTAASR
jgi:glycine cleavage system aminomethyltransferase T